MAWDDLTPTSDEGVRIEHIEPGYVRYRDHEGRRWEVAGQCDRRGFCLIGAVIRTASGLEEIQSLEHLDALKAELGMERIDSELDVPVRPGFEGCCLFEFNVLPDAD